MVDIRRYFNESGDLLPEEDILATQAITAEEAEQEAGPTEQVPFRFTEQALNPRAQAVRDRAQRDPRARSALGQYTAPIMPGSAQDPMARDFALGLPVISQTFGSGDNAFERNVFDIDTIGASLGISPERIAELRGLNPTTTERVRVGSGEGATYVDPQEGESGTEAITRMVNAELRSQGIIPALGDRTGGRDGSPAEQLRRQYQVETTKYGVPNLTDEEAILRGLMTMPADEQLGSTFQAFGKPGSKAAGEDLATLLQRGRGSEIMDPSKLSEQDYQNLIKASSRQFRKGGQLEGDKVLSNIMKGITMAGMAAVTGGAFAPAIAGALGIGAGTGLFGAGTLGSSIATGAIGGGVGGTTMSALQGVDAGELDLSNVAKSAGMGVLGGGALGGIAHGIGSLGSASNLPEGVIRTPAGLKYIQQTGEGTAKLISASQAQAQGLLGGASNSSGLLSSAEETAQTISPGKLAAQTAEGGLTGAQRALGEQQMKQQVYQQAGEAAGEHSLGLQTMYSRQARAAGMGGDGSIFVQKLPDSAFYDPNEYMDLGSSQEDLY